MNYTDLLGKAWEDMHCGEVVVEGLRRYGMERAALYVPADQDAAAQLVTSLERDSGVGAWMLVATPSMKHCACECDVIVSDGPRDQDGQYHVSLMLKETTGLVLTSSKRHGVHCVPLARLQGVRGIYRWLPGVDRPVYGVMP